MVLMNKVSILEDQKQYKETKFYKMTTILQIVLNKNLFILQQLKDL